MLTGASFVLDYFGPFQVRKLSGEPVLFASKRSAQIVALLGLAESGQRDREQLCDLLWPGDAPSATRPRLRQELNRLRKAFGDDCPVHSSGGDLYLSPLPGLRPRDVLKMGEDELLKFAEQPPLGQGWDDDWVRLERRVTERIFAERALGFARTHFDGGDPAAAQPLVEAVLRRQPRHEEATALAVRVHASLGGASDALARVLRFRRETGENLGKVNQPLRSDARESVLAWPSVPRPTGELIGRDELLQQLDALLARPGRHLVTLVGPSGIGKTRLALEWASRAGGSRVLFAPLAEIEDPAEFGEFLARGAGLPQAAGIDRLAQLGRWLGSLPAVLIADNLEHLLPEVATYLEALLQLAPRLSVIGTSLRPTGLPGEVILQPGPIAPTDAVELLIRHGARRELGPELDQVAAQLGGVPLALRLTGAKLRFLTPAQALADLRREPPTQVGRADRHASVAHTLQWTVQELGAPLRDALNRLVEFRGKWTLEQGVAILDTPEALVRLGELVERDILRVRPQPGGVAFEIPEALREHIASARTAEVAAEAQAAFHASTARLIDEWIPRTSTPMSLDKLTQLDGLRDALARCEPLPPILTRAWAYEICRGLATRIVDRAQPAVINALATPREQGQAWLGRAFALSRMGRLAEMNESIEAGLKVAEPDEVMSLRGVQVYGQMRIGDVEGALASGHALAASLTHEPPAARARVLATIALVAHHAQRDEEAIKLYAEAYRLSTESDHQPFRCQAAIMAASSCLQMNQPADALAWFAKVADVIPLVGDPFTSVNAVEVEGRIRYALGHFPAAVAAFREALRTWHTLGNDHQVADQANSLARAQVEVDENPAPALLRAWRLFESLGDEGGLAIVRITALRWLIRQGELDLAARVRSRVEERLEQPHIHLVQSEHQLLSKWGQGLPDSPPENGELLQFLTQNVGLDELETVS